jgi:hypothetical protein
MRSANGYGFLSRVMKMFKKDCGSYIACEYYLKKTIESHMLNG